MGNDFSDDDFDFGGIAVEPLSAEDAERIGMHVAPPEPTVNGNGSAHYDEPDPRAIKQPRRPNGAAHYEEQLASVSRGAIKTLIKHEAYADAAVLLMHAPDACKAWGNAAADNDRIARAIDWLSEPTDNPVLLALTATAPIVLQMFRNHEPALQPAPRGFQLPTFTRDPETGKRRIGRRTVRLPKIGIRLQNFPFYAAATNDPNALVRHVFGNAKIQAELKKQGIEVEFVAD